MPCRFTSAHEVAKVENAIEILKTISLTVIRSTNERFDASNLHRTEKVNNVFALDLVKMSEVHVKYMCVWLAHSRIHGITCPKLRGHIDNLMALTTLNIISEYKDDGFEYGYFKPGFARLIDDAIKLILNKLRP